MNTEKNKVASYRKRYEQLKQLRAPWVPVWKELAAYMAPTRVPLTASRRMQAAA